MYFPPLRAAGSALMLALFGAACGIIATAAIVGLVGSNGRAAGSMIALAFAGVFVLPLAGLGLVFIGVAVWTAFNSLTVQISNEGLLTERRCFGLLLARQRMARPDIAALDARLAAKYIGVFGAARYYCLVARGDDRAMLVADSLKGPDTAADVRNMMIERLKLPELATASNKIPVAAAATA